MDRRATVGCIAGVEQHQPRIIDPAIGIFKTGPKNAGLERGTGGIAREVEDARRRQKLASAQMVVDEQPEPQQPGRPQAGAIGQYEAQRPDDVRRDPPQHLALAQRLAHQTEIVVFEIAQAAMNKPGRAR